jgi:hypothetical protein
MWKNREQMEEILFLLSPSRWPVQLREPSTSEDAEFASILRTLKDSFDNAFTAMISFQTKNSERIFSTGINSKQTLLVYIEFITTRVLFTFFCSNDLHASRFPGNAHQTAEGEVGEEQTGGG